jgi:light-regulated signal transduction histidine kinase (bacteriophytochrome)
MNELVEGTMIEINKSINHKAEIKVGKLHTVKADYGLIYQVLFHLISNAIKYSANKTNSVIEISSEENGGEVTFSVKDNGAGFDMKYADKLFTIFQRLHSQEEFEGIGLGLAIVQRIINKHGGKTWAEAKINEGATFYFTLNNN